MFITLFQINKKNSCHLRLLEPEKHQNNSLRTTRLAYSKDWISPRVPPIDTHQVPSGHSWPVCVWGLLEYVGPLSCFNGLAPAPVPPSLRPRAPSCIRLSHAWNETARVRIPRARLGHDEGGARLQLTIDPLTFNWAYIISEHKINSSGEVGQIKQLVPVFFSGSLWTAATPQKWALLHAMCLHISWNWVWIYNILQGSKEKGPNLVVTLIWCHLGVLNCIYDV